MAKRGKNGGSLSVPVCVFRAFVLCLPDVENRGCLEGMVLYGGLLYAGSFSGMVENEGSLYFAFCLCVLFLPNVKNHGNLCV